MEPLVELVHRYGFHWVPFVAVSPYAGSAPAIASLKPSAFIGLPAEKTQGSWAGSLGCDPVVLGRLDARSVEDTGLFGNLGQLDDPPDPGACAFYSGSLDSGWSTGSACDAYAQVSGFFCVPNWYVQGA